MTWRSRSVPERPPAGAFRNAGSRGRSEGPTGCAVTDVAPGLEILEGVAEAVVVDAQSGAEHAAMEGRCGGREESDNLLRQSRRPGSRSVCFSDDREVHARAVCVGDEAQVEGLGGRCRPMLEDESELVVVTKQIGVVVSPIMLSGSLC